MGRPHVGAVRLFAGLPSLTDPALAGATAGALAGMAEAIMMQLQGVGARGLDGAIVLLAASAEISVPIGIVVAVGIRLIRAAFPTGIWRGIDPRTAAGWIYGLGAMLPVLAAAYFRLFLYLIAHFRNLSLAALASVFLSIAAAVSSIGCAGFVATIAQRTTRGRWARP